MSSIPYQFAGPSGSVTFEWAPHRDEPLRIARDFNTAADALEDEYKMLVAAREVVVGDVESHFAAGEGPGGTWPALKLSYYERKKLEGAAIMTDELLPSGEASYLTDTGAGRAVATARESYRIEADGLGGTITFDATPPHFMIEHNRGIPDRETHGGIADGPNPLPQREWMWLSEGAAQGIFHIFEDFVDDAVAIVMNPLTGGANIRTTAGFFQSPTAFYG